MKVLKDNWLIWVPKIVQKMKVESQTHRKTYLLFLHVLSECSKKSAEDISERKPYMILTVEIMINYVIDPDILILFICLHKLLHSKMPKNHPEFLVLLEVSSDLVCSSIIHCLLIEWQ